MINSSPLVSVIIPCYNHELFVKQSIQSVLAQTYSNIELIVIDDASSDGSVNVITQLAEANHFYFERQSENKGISETLNRALLKAKGKYVAFLASDDCMLPERIEKQVATMEQDLSVGLCYGMTQAINAKGKPVDGPAIFKGFKGDVFKRLLFSNFIPAPTVMVRRELFSQVGGFDKNIKIEDWYMWLKLAKVCKFDFIDEVLACYRQHENNFSKNYWIMFKADIQVLSLWTHEGSMFYLSCLNAFRRFLKNQFSL